MCDEDRELLEYASLLHDIGYHSHSKHHKHALYLILNADLKGFKEEEIAIIGHVADIIASPHPRNDMRNSLAYLRMYANGLHDYQGYYV